MKLFGHPVHPLFVHFPTALLPMDLGLTILYKSTGNASLYQAGVYCLSAGTAIGLFALMTGIIDLLAVPRSDKKAIGLALYHGCINGLVVMVFGIIAYKAWLAFPAPFFISGVQIAIKAILIIVLFVGNYLGGRLIYTYYIGIDLKKQTHGNSAN